MVNGRPNSKKPACRLQKNQVGKKLGLGLIVDMTGCLTGENLIMRPNLCIVAAVLLIQGAAIPSGLAAAQEYSTRLTASLSFVGGDETALSWVASGETRTSRPAPGGNVDAIFRASLGQARSDGDTRETVDRIGADLRYAIGSLQFVEVDARSVFTADSLFHPMIARFKYGLQLAAGPVKVRGGLGAEKERGAVAVGGLAIGVEVAGRGMKSHVKMFNGWGRGLKLSLESYNSAVVKIAGGFSATLDANTFVRRYRKAESNEFDLEVLAGVGYVWE